MTRVLLAKPTVLIIGINGFIGHHLTRRIIDTTDWQVHGIDRQCDRLAPWRGHPRFQFFEGDITRDHERIEAQVRNCDVVLPLAAIATPATYVREPLRVFELDFEANLPIVRHCVRHGKRVVFPSSSEVYGMCEDAAFDPLHSKLVYGPVDKPRWIYASAKQLLDRVIHAYGQQEGLRYTLFRPFNWIGTGLDSLHALEEGPSRVVSQFLGRIIRGEPIQLVDGGRQRRCFTDIGDGIDALMKIIANDGGVADGKIYNIGHPGNNVSIRTLAEDMLALALTLPDFREAAARVQLAEVSGDAYYGPGYQDMQHRVPDIGNTMQELGWTPRIPLAQALRTLFDLSRPSAAC